MGWARADGLQDEFGEASSDEEGDEDDEPPTKPALGKRKADTIPKAKPPKKRPEKKPRRMFSPLALTDIPLIVYCRRRQSRGRVRARDGECAPVERGVGELVAVLCVCCSLYVVSFWSCHRGYACS